MGAAIYNREDFKHPADGWYMIEAKGDHPNREAGVVQVIDAPAISSIVNRFNADSDGGKLRHGDMMLVDHEHFSSDPDKETRAYGWLERLQSREDGVYGKIRWSKTGKEAVDGGDYRFFSTEYAPEDLEAVKNRGANFVRPQRLDGLTLTNMNNNRGQKAITNSDRGNRSEAEAPKVPESSRRNAAAELRKMAETEMVESGCGNLQAWGRVMSRERRLVAVSSGKSLPDKPVMLSASEFASGLIMEEAKKLASGSLATNVTRVKNRYPSLAKMVNREADFAPLESFEPAARAAYDKAAERGNLDALYDNLFKSLDYSARRDFVFEIRKLAAQYPNLGYDGRWDKLKAISPSLYWKFILTFDPTNLPTKREEE